MTEQPETVWRALTIQQPWVYAICELGKNIENRTWPVPPKYLNKRCESCNGHPGYGSGSCGRCRNVNPGYEPFRIMIHAGAAWDRTTFPWNRAEGWMNRSVKITKAPREWGWNNRTFYRFSGGHIVDSHEEDLPFSAVVAVATIAGQHRAGQYLDAGSPPDCITTGCAHDPAAGRTDISAPVTPNPWAVMKSGMWHWELTDVIVLDQPVPTKGGQRLWKPNDQTIEAVEAQL